MAALWESLISLFSPENLFAGLVALIRILLVLLLAQILMRIGRFFFDRIFVTKEGRKQYLDPAQVKTMNKLLKSALSYAVYFFTGTIVLSILGVPIASLLAGAGIVGLALGFGAQNLVRDVICGFFILFENQFSVGEMVKVAGVEGFVEEIGLRTTVIRSFGGEMHIIRNGLIENVANYSRSNMRVRVIVSIAYEEDINRAMEVIQAACDAVVAGNEAIVEAPKPLGVSDLADSGMDIMVVGRTKPMNQWAVERLLRQRIKEHFDRAGIEIPYPRRVIYHKAASKEEVFGKVEESYGEQKT